MKELDTAKIHDVEQYLEWYTNLSVEEAQTVWSKLKKIVNPGYSPRVLDEAAAIDRFFTVQGGYGGPDPNNSQEAKWAKQRIENANKLRQFLSFAEEFEQPLYIGKWFDGELAYIHMGNPSKGFVFCEPEKYITRIPAKDYSDVTPASLRAALGSTRQEGDAALVPSDAENSMTEVGLTEQLKAHEDAMAELEQTLDDTKNAKTGELAELKAQMDAIKAELEAKIEKRMAELNEKKRQMEEMKYQLEGQIYLLDSQIYAIRCYAGEVVKFGKIRSGKKAPDEEPIVIHQKLRFLDEDLGRLASLYSIEWEDISMFESFLKHSPIALDTFAPNERCVVLVRLSRTGKKIASDNNIPYQNLLDTYDYYHGKTVGIIIRNGENVWLGWTDETRVHIDDDLIITQAIKVDEQPADTPDFIFESERERYIKKQREERKRILDGLVSRTFVYNVLQGIVDHSDMLPLPAGVKLSKQSPYVQYAVADAWLTDNRFGSFTDIIKRCNERITEGDMLLTCQSLVPEHWSDGRYVSADRPWDNSRGRGEKNRTHDCSVDDCKIYKANLVEFDAPIDMVRYRYPDKNIPLKSEAWRFDEYPEDFKGAVVIERYQTEPNRHVFLSVEKSDVWYYGRKADKPARANFEVYDKEIINLTYMNSIWLEWVINNKKLGGWSVGGKAVDYAYAIRYLKTAMDFIKAREVEEKALIDAENPEICKDADWPLQLSEWKLEKKVRTITKHQAKRFVKAVLASK